MHGIFRNISYFTRTLSSLGPNLACIFKEPSIYTQAARKVLFVRMICVLCALQAYNLCKPEQEVSCSVCAFLFFIYVLHIWHHSLLIPYHQEQLLDSEEQKYTSRFSSLLLITNQMEKNTTLLCRTAFILVYLQKTAQIIVNMLFWKTKVFYLYGTNDLKCSISTEG